MQLDPTALAKNSEIVADLLKQLSNKYRLMILCALSEDELSVGQLNERIPLSQSALSQHLAKLRDNEIVETRRESQTIYYQVSNPKIKALLEVLQAHYC